MLTIDGIHPSVVVQPESVGDLSAAIREAKGSIVPMGSGTHMEFGNPLRSADCLLDLSGLNRITAYNPADLTVHVEAGVRLGELQKVLENNNQALLLDPWNGPDATIGGIAAANAQGPLRAAGTIRDWIIGMRVVHADGRISNTGGRVVKNVTGYDLSKMYTGSLGTLAVIAEISLKLRSRFGKTTTAIANCNDLAGALALIHEVRKSPLQPICAELEGPDPTVWLRFGERREAVDWQLSNLPPGPWSVFEGDAELARWQELRTRFKEMGPVVLRVVGTPSAIGGIIQTFKPSAWIAHALSGIVLMTVSSPEDIRRIRAGFPAVIERAPLDLRREVPTFGVPPGALRLMKEMKHTLDPAGRLNPGRHIDGE